MVEIGDFDCVGPGAGTSVMTDIAVDKTGKVYGVSPAAAWPLVIKDVFVIAWRNGRSRTASASRG